MKHFNINIRYIEDTPEKTIETLCHDEFRMRYSSLVKLSTKNTPFDWGFKVKVADEYFSAYGVLFKRSAGLIIWK